MQIAIGIVLGVLAVSNLPALLRGVDFLLGLFFLAVVLGALGVFIAIGWPYSIIICAAFVALGAGIWAKGRQSHTHKLMSEDEHRQFISRHQRKGLRETI